MLTRLALARGATVLALLLPHPLRSQAAPADSLRLAPAWDVAARQPREPVLAFALSRRMVAADGRLVVVVGRSDLSPLLEVSGLGARLPLHGARLPSGDLEVVAYLDAPAGDWRELGRFPLRRVAVAGFDTAAVRPRLDLQSDGQVAAQLPPVPPPGVRDGAYQDLTVNGGVDAALRRGGADASAQALLLGASRMPGRLRAAQLGPRAPALDLASYGLRLADGRVALTAGHIAVGDDRFLGSQFRSRGLAADVRLSSRLDAKVAAVAGSEIVGWDDPVGLARPSHRVLLGSLGIEALPALPGVLRLELTGLQGALQPLPAFNQAAITDRERSDGLGAQLAASDPSHRVRLALGLARSRFANPADPALARDSALVPVRPETRSARFGELAFDALRGAHLGSTTASLTMTARDERVDPQYRSVAAALQADRDQRSLEASGSLDALQLQLAASSGRDNLDDVATLLTTRSYTRSLGAALPLAQLLRAPPTAWWWPALTLAWQAVHQRGGPAPANGGFRLDAQVPDQLTSNLTLGAAWQRAAWSLAWRYARSLVDNRQPGRERADFATDAPGLTLTLTPSPKISLTADASLEAQHNVELGQRSANRRLSLQGAWQAVGHLAFSATGSWADANDPLATQRGTSTDLHFEVSQGFDLFSRLQDGTRGRVFLRFAHTGSALRLAGAPGPSVRQWALNTGLSLRLF